MTPKPMKLGEVRALIVEAFERDTPTADVLLWLNRLRSRGWPSGNVAPFTYSDLLAFMRDGIPNLDRAAWDAFLASCDELEDRS